MSFLKYKKNKDKIAYDYSSLFEIVLEDAEGGFFFFFFFFLVGTTSSNDSLRIWS